MTIRIYTLAKNLKKTSKQVCDACQDLGFKANTPFHSLTDEEVAQIEKYFSEGNVEAPAEVAKELPEMVPPTSIPSQEPKKVQVISTPVIKPRTNGFTSLFGGFSKTTKKASVDGEGEQSEESGDVVATDGGSDNNSVETVNDVVSENVTQQVVVEQTENTVVTEENAASQQNLDVDVAASNEKVVEAEEKQPKGCEEVSIVEQDTPEVAGESKSNDERDDVNASENVLTDADSQTAENKADVAEAPSVAESKADQVAVSEDEQSKTSAVQESGSEPKVEETETEPVSVEANDVAAVVGAREADDAKKTVDLSQKKSAAPLAGAISRKGKDNRNEQRKNNAPIKPIDNRTSRPAPLSPPAYATQFERTQALDEMKRPPMITSNKNGGRVQVLGAAPKKPDSNGAANKPGAKNAGNRPKVTIHLAAMPTQTAKAPVKKAQEPVAQKPIKTFNPKDFQSPLRTLVEERKTKGQGGVGDKKEVVSDLKDKSQRPGKVGQSAFGAAAENVHGRKPGRSGERGVAEEELSRKPTNNNNNKRRGNNRGFESQDDDDFGYSQRVGRNRKSSNSKATVVTAPRTSDIVIEMPCTVKGFSEATGKSVAELIKTLMKLGMMMTMNQTLEAEVIELLIMEFDLKATIKKPATLEEQFVDTAFDAVDPPESLEPRAPVVTFLGHVDHGKTSLLDRILNLHVVSGEKGGITQHIRAYRVAAPNGGAVTFVDTPGHEAFTEMRARGANCTDIAVLVVAADDGVMPQTEEAISHAKAAGVPIVVALNKMDLPGVKRDRILQELASNDLVPVEWGGDVEVIDTSAITGMGVDKLLETLLLVAEISELKANPHRNATGVVLESSMQAGEGVVCKALVQNGTLKNGDVVLCGSSYGRVRSMTDTLDSHKRIKEAGPSVPVSLTGLDVAPDAGSKFVVLEDISVARQIAEERAKLARELELAGSASHVTLESLFERINSAKTQQTLNVIIRADVRGSIEAIRKELGKLDHPEVKVKILQASVGGVTEADVYLADASDAIIVGFNVVPDEGARALAEAKKVQVRRYDIIYKLSEDIRAALEGMLKPIEQVKELGRALVLRTFNISRVGVIAGSRVIHGSIERDCQIRVIRDSRIIGEYTLDTLKREKDDAKEVREGYECGIKLKNYNDVKEGDVLEAFKIEEVARTL